MNQIWQYVIIIAVLLIISLVVIKFHKKDFGAEINKLVQSTQNLDNEVQQAVSKNIPEFNDYQVGFLQRLKKLIIQFRQNIDQSSVWLSSLNHKKSRKNAFWGNVKNKKNGGSSHRTVPFCGKAMRSMTYPRFF